MAAILRSTVGSSAGAPMLALQLHHEEPEWQFGEVEYGPRGSWDVVSSCLHIASHLNAIYQRLGSVHAPYRTVAPSTAISAPGDHLTGAWEGSGVRARHVKVELSFLAAVFERDVGPDAVPRRRFAYHRECDDADTIIGDLLNTMATHLRSGSPGGAIFLQAVVLALIHHAIPAPTSVAEAVAARRGLSPTQLSLALELIEAKLLHRISLVELASALSVSTRYFCRAFRGSTGTSPHQFIIKRRIELARSLIEDGNLSLADVAIAAGFTHHSQMATTFRRVMGVPPSHFRTARTNFN